MKRLIYKLLRLSNDVNAISKGKYGKRILRKASLRSTSKLINKLFK